ncbi:hypothetical protein HK097_008508 [Rhizophlyctis rosea]|uniref:Cilia- and flagella-associated protein 53 n=1 Tax=Rhizophlyctis rosea TaxID=64517 RepID=A0AAD5X594_9FUNG|nr:hypothetical protein HK097_008508 [Rhizophlyctis rosea]
MAMLFQSAPRHGAMRSSDFIIQNRRREEELRNKMIETTQYYAKAAAKSRFEENTTAAIRRKHILHRFEELKGQMRDDLEGRRERLRQLYQQDEDRHRAELNRMEETRESRVEQMKARMKELKEKREEERKKIVEEKMLQKWRNECDELRAIESRILEKEVAEARAEQLVERTEKLAIAAIEKKYYDDLWEQDRQKKIHREEEDKARQKALNESTTKTLTDQLALLRIQALEEARLKEEEASLMREDARLRALESSRLHLQKLQQQRQIRADLDAFNRQKLLQRQREVQESLEMDLKIVNEFLEAGEKEREGKNRRKEELRREMIAYREHLEEQRRVEREREREIDRMYREEEDRLWRQKAERWRREQMARDRLMKEVMEGRQEQLDYARHQTHIKLEQIRTERQLLEEQILRAQEEEKAEKIKQARIAKEYQDSLVVQMEMGKGRIERERKEREIEAQKEKEEEKKYRELLKREIERAEQLPRVGAFRASNRAAQLAAVPVTL